MALHVKQSQSTWLRVRAGKLSHKNGDGSFTEFDAIDGIITGVRYEDGEYEGQKTCQLHIRMVDPKTGEQSIVSGNFMYFHNKAYDTVSVWAGMILGRLCSLEAALKKDEHLLIGIYSWNDKSCASLARFSSPQTKIQGESIKTPDRALKAISYLTERYGPWDDARQLAGSGAPQVTHPPTSTKPGSDEPPLAEPPPDQGWAGKDDLPF